MTMLDRMRRHKNWLKWSLGLVIVAFAIFYIPDFLRTTSGAAPGEWLAEVEGRPITAGEFRRTYQAQLQAYRGAYGSNMSEQLLRQLGIEQQILQQMIDERAALAEADRLGIDVTDAEVRERIFSIPSLQENGRFIGEERYRQLLRMQRPPVTPAEFERGLRNSLILEKLRGALTGWMAVSDKELEAEYRRRNEKVKLEVVALSADKFRDQVTASDAEIAAHFEPRKADYRIGEKRKIRYALVDLETIRAKVAVPAADIDRYYNQNIEQYTTPEQVRASHILFKTEGQVEAAVRVRAEEVLKRAKAGADFAELAKKYSEDESNAQQGGDLDYFGRGRMVPEFEAVAFEQAPGTISDLVKTDYGFHIIKVVDKKAEQTRSLAEVRQQISDQLAWETAQRRGEEAARALEAAVRRPGDLDRAGKTRGLDVRESGFFLRDEPIAGLGPAPEAAARAFDMTDGQTSGAVRVARGHVVFTMVGKQDAYIPKLDEVRDRVREDVVRKKAADAAKTRAEAIAGQLRAASDFAKAAKGAGVEAKATELIGRDSPLPDLGVSPAIDAVAFSLPVRGVSGPIATDQGTAIVRVVERKDVTPIEMAAAKDRFREELLTERRNRFFSAYMVKAKQRMRIEIDRETLAQVVG